jgi:hypothetical protein
MTDLFVLEALRAGKEKGGKEGDRGLFIGEVSLEEGLGFERGRRSNGSGACCARGGLRPEEGGDADMWTRAVSEEKERPAYPLGILPGWAVGWKLA